MMIVAVENFSQNVKIVEFPELGLTKILKIFHQTIPKKASVQQILLQIKRNVSTQIFAG